MASTHDTSPDTTRTATTPPTTTRSAGGARPPGAPRVSPAGTHRSNSAWGWIVGLLVAFAVVWFIWWWWTGQDVAAEPEVEVSTVHEIGMIVPAIDRNFSESFGYDDPFGLRELPQVA